VLTLCFFDGTGDAGDSVHHYLFARYAPSHPELFFDHWAKPVYVLLASPFAQFGFIGVKVFNVLVMLFTLLFTFKIAQKLDLKNVVLTSVFIIFAPLCFALTFSGLTEPLFALFISIGIYSVLKKNYLTASLLISFLPFIRSEGLIFLGVFGLYFLLKKEWRAIPVLLFGHLAYSIAGYFVYNDLFWVFNKIPYAHLSSVYGKGGLFHYVDQLTYVIGIPIYIFLGLGSIGVLWKTFKKKTTLELQVLIFLGFFAFFIAHTLFWYLGIFNSMGLKRVFVGVIPLIAILSLVGFNFLTEEVLRMQKTQRRIAQGLLIGLIIIFPFTSNPAALNFDRDLKLSQDQRTADKIGQYVVKNLGIDHRFLFSHPYLSEALDIDHFDQTKHFGLDIPTLERSKSGDVVIWENWFALVESGVTQEWLDSRTEFTHLYTTQSVDRGRDIIYSVYVRN
jgi:hypothetical protein